VKRLRWDSIDRGRPLPKHPYRDSVLLYGALALLVVVIAYATGGGLTKAVVTAVIVFVVATTWSWRSWRNRLREERLRREAERPR
jgi:membrane protein implicated in regulation of membrane protease activity